MNRDFHAEAPNRLWVTDITEFRIPAGKAYLSPVIDCHDGMPVAWTDRHQAGRRAGQPDAARGVLHARGRASVRSSTAIEAATTGGPDGSASARSTG